MLCASVRLMPSMSGHSDRPRQRLASRPAADHNLVATPGAPPEDRFFRHLVGSLRNGVIAIYRDGTIALVNEEAYRIFALAPQSRNVGRSFAEVFRDRPDVIRVLSGAFELTTLPNRAELRLKDLDRVIGYTLSQVKDEMGRAIGAVLFFKDLTQVEQLEERERLRDRLASLGEMAAGIAHELKNPLAGIEVMAGLLRRQVAESPDAQSLLGDIISEAKLANSIVVQMLEFVRPIRLQVERTDVGDAIVCIDFCRGDSGSFAVGRAPPDLCAFQLLWEMMRFILRAFAKKQYGLRLAVFGFTFEPEEMCADAIGHEKRGRH